MVQQRTLLDGQLNENQNVLEELNKLNEDKNTVRIDENLIWMLLIYNLLFFLGLQTHWAYFSETKF